MTSRRLYYFLVTSLVLLTVALFGVTYVVKNMIDKKGAALTSMKAKSLALQQEKKELGKAKEQIRTYADLGEVTSAIVPEDKSQAEAVREIVKIAAASNISLTSITFPASTLGSSSAKNTPASAAQNPSSKAESITNKNLSQLVPVKNIPGVYALTITLTNSGQDTTYPKFINFLAGLEGNRRTSQVTSLTISPATDNPNFITFTLTLNGYIKP